MEHVDVVVVVEQRAQRLAAPHRARSRPARRPSSTASTRRTSPADHRPRSRRRTRTGCTASRRGCPRTRARAPASRSTTRRRRRTRPAPGARTPVRRRASGRLQHRPADPQAAPRAGVPEPHQHAERGQRVDRRPLGAGGQPEPHAGQRQPRPEPQSRPPRAALPGGHPGAGPVPVGDQAGRGAEQRRTPGRCRAAPAGTAPGACRRSRAAARRRQPSSVEPVSRRTSRISTSTISDPTTAAAIRQPNGSIPNAFSPSAISHLPTSGWTTIDGSSFQTPVVRPSRILSLAFSTYSRT